MKKVLFYLAALLSIVLIVNILDVVLHYSDRLTRFGWGYVAGRALLLAVFLFLSFYLYRKAYRKA